MDNHFRYTDDELEALFESCQLKLMYFNHEAHLRLACLRIKKYGTTWAIENMTRRIHDYATSLGAAKNHNHTVTVAAVKVVAHFMGRANEDSFAELVIKFARMKHQFKELLFSHYSIDIFNEEAARIQYLEPDLQPFDS
ncbi:MAG: hypothetical protein AAGJ93_09005 [Bacteroidota bacterium]